MKLIFIYLLFAAITLEACANESIDETVINDVIANMGKGICDSIPSGSVISNVKVGDKKTLSESATADVVEIGVEFDFNVNGVMKHRITSLIYVKKGSAYKLAAMGDCRYEVLLGDFLEK